MKFPKNRISHQGAGHDNAGNMIQLDGRITKMTASTGSTSSEERLWFYDGEGRRVREEHWAVAGSARTLQWETVFVYDPLGALVAEYDTRPPGTAGIRYLTADHLGSTRMVTKESGTTEAQVVDTRHDYLPFGEEVRSTGGPKEKFTGKERADVVGTRVDYFGARYMSAMLGRFTSPDPLRWLEWQRGGDEERQEFAAFMSNPQNFNQYSYVRNGPLIATDPSGQYICTGTQVECDQVERQLVDARTSKNADVRRAANAYGAQGVDNGVSVGFTGRGARGTQATTGYVTNQKGEVSGIQVTLNSSDFVGKDNVKAGRDVVHEGSHVADFQEAWIETLFTPTFDAKTTHLQSEIRAYMTGYAYGRERGTGQFGPPPFNSQFLELKSPAAITLFLMMTPSNRVPFLNYRDMGASINPGRRR